MHPNIVDITYALLKYSNEKLRLERDRGFYRVIRTRDGEEDLPIGWITVDEHRALVDEKLVTKE